MTNKTDNTRHAPHHDTAAPLHHRDSALESLGKAIFDPVREAAGEADDEVKEARHRAQVRQEQQDQDQADGRN